MDAILIPSILGIIIIIIGINNMKGNINSIHWYHRKRVTDENKTIFGNLMGSGTIACGIGILCFGVFSFISSLTDRMFFTTIGSVIVIISLVVGVTISLYAKHMKVDDAFNYSLYKQLNASLKYKDYELRSTYTEYITNIGSYDRQFPYRETDFYNFDKFLFTTWRDKPNGKGKDKISWGVEV